MADELIPVGQKGNSKTLKDLGGGLFAEQIYIAGGDPASSSKGAANLATSQVAPLTSHTTAAIARATRVACTIVNTGATVVYLGPATVTALNGVRLDPGASRTFTTVALIDSISVGATGAIDVQDEYN
jgi:hypothetical protein